MLTVVICPFFWTGPNGITREARAVYLRDGVIVGRDTYPYQPGELPLTPVKALKKFGFKTVGRLKQSKPGLDMYKLGDKGPDFLAPQTWHGEITKAGT